MLCPFKLIVNSVGDANSVFLQTKTNSIMIDFGYGNKNLFTNELLCQIVDSKELLVSHYHKDHYNGLIELPENELSIYNLYYPYIPIFSDITLNQKLLKEIKFINYATMVCTGSKAYDFVTLLKQKNKQDIELNYHPLYKGMTLNDKDYKVIWPPRNGDFFNLRTLRKGITEIDSIIKSLPQVSELWKKFDRFEIDSETQQFKNDMNDSVGLINNAETFFYTNKKKILEIDEKLRKITNRFSVSLYKEKEFLFLGDLEQEELTVCLNNLIADNNGKPIFVKYLITPHHGTKKQYIPEISKFIKADYVISSNGTKRYFDYEMKYDKIGKYTHCTHKNGNFYGLDTLLFVNFINNNI